MKKIFSFIIKKLKKENKTHLLLFFVIFLVGSLIRIYYLFQPIRYDEAATFMIFASPEGAGLFTYFFPNNHVFHTLLVYISYLFFGNHEWTLRLPALLAGIFLIPATYLFARKFYNKKIALLACTLVAASSVLVEYSTNARGYTILVFIFLLLFILAAYLKDNFNVWGWIAFIILSALGFFTIPIMIYPFGIIILWLFFSIIFRKTKVKQFLLSKIVFVALVLIALLTHFLYRPVIQKTHGLRELIKIISSGDISWSEFFKGLPKYLDQLWHFWMRDIPIWLSLILVLGFILSLIFYKRLSKYVIPLILPIVFWLLIMILAKPVLTFLRVWLFLLPLLLTLASAGIYFVLDLLFKKTKIKQELIFSLILVFLLFGLLFNLSRNDSVLKSTETGILKDAKEIALFLKSNLKESNKVIAMCPSEFPLQYYFDLHGASKEFRLPVDGQPQQYLKGKNKRAVVVVNKSKGQTIEEILKAYGLESFSPKKIQHFGSADLYEIRRKD